MAKRFPQYAYAFNKYIWMNPGSVEVQQFIVNVTEDIIRRYAVDGIHMDDYFYPYSDGTEFLDAAIYTAYQQQGGKLNKDDSIWKNGVPAGITGLSSSDSLYCQNELALTYITLSYLLNSIEKEIID